MKQKNYYSALNAGKGHCLRGDWGMSKHDSILSQLYFFFNFLSKMKISLLFVKAIKKIAK
jgi:hypothetical protein